MQRAFAAPLVIHKKWTAVAQHDVSGLEVPIKKVMAAGAQQKVRQAAEVVFQRLFVERDAGEPEKIVFEIIQIPGDGLAIEAVAWIADFVIQIAAGFDLKAWQHGHNLAIRFNRLRSNVLAGPILREELKKRRVSQVFFEIGAVPGKQYDDAILLARGVQKVLDGRFNHRALRRVAPGAAEADELLEFADLSMDLASREVRRGDRAMTLTRTEFALLELFLRRPRRVLERSFILEEVWGFDFPTTANSLEVYVGYLRRKTEAEDEPRLLHTVRGVGYVLREDPA